MSIPTSEPILDDDDNSKPPVRQRRQRRLDLDGNGQPERLAALTAQTTPGRDFLLFLLVGSAILSAALLFDSPALYLLAALFLPFLSPVIGISVAATAGDGFHLIKSLGMTLTGALILFAGGLLAGFGSTFLPAAVYEQAGFFARFSWPNLVVLVIGAGLTTVIMGRSPRVKPLIPNVALGFALYLPAGVAGFGVTSGLAGFWPDALIVFGVHLVVAVLAGSLALMLSGLRLQNMLGYAATAVFAAGTALSLALLSGLGPVVGAPAFPGGSEGVPTAAVSVVVTLTPTPPVQAATRTPTATNTLVPSLTPSKTVTPKPTPIWAKVWSPEGNGGFIRKEPDGKSAIISSLINDSPVQVLGEPVQGEGGPWFRILTESGLEGWMVQNLLVMPTPAPNW